MSTTTRPPYDPIDLSPMTFWSGTHADREEIFAQLRPHRPVSWHRPVGVPVDPDDEGFWAVTGHPEILEISSRPDLFSSQRKGFMYDNLPAEFYQAAGSILGLDPPNHTKLRRLVAAGFTPRRIATIEGQIRRQASLIVDDFLAGPREVDFMEAVAARLPMWTICDAVGIPEEQRAEITRIALEANSTHDPETQRGRTPTQVLGEAIEILVTAALKLAATRRDEPRDDLMSALVSAEVDGERLSDQEIASFFILLVVAGTDTTRNSTGHAQLLLAANPEQRALLMSDLDKYMTGAVEEILRWSTPVMTMRRTATEDVELGGMHIREGDKVVLYYAAANFDERVWDEPTRFDITREANKHLAFGGRGPHHCLGAPLARTQMRVMLTELLTRVPDLKFGEPFFELSNFIAVIKRLPCTRPA
ncbi:MAG TPA: cytochrome P450 [Amycolatopsis sp.]|nr:cytochrome P450 [Amycolatopsis sp.]